MTVLQCFNYHEKRLLVLQPQHWELTDMTFGFLLESTTYFLVIVIIYDNQRHHAAMAHIYSQVILSPSILHIKSLT